MIRRYLSTLCLLLWVLPVGAEVKLAPLFRDGAVLQRGKPVPVWGRAQPAEKVTVRFGGQSVEATADSSGRWSVKLQPMEANATEQELVVVGSNELRVRGVLVGEVWLCSGQSNMHWPVTSALNSEQEIAAAKNPLIHYFGVSNEVAETPQEDTPGEWKAVTPENVGEFSATGYFFARELQPAIGVPVGIIKATPGGSGIDSWMSAQGLASLPFYSELDERWKKVLAAFPTKQAEYKTAMDKWNADSEAAKAAGKKFTAPKPRVPEGPKSRSALAGLFNANIHPFIPYALRGFLWYQGEGNASRFTQYRVMLPTMIQQWRKDFNQEDAFFLVVQLANYALPSEPDGRQWAFQREAQAEALKLPQTGLALAIDIGERDNIHPLNKQEVGRRLSLLARQKAYGQPVNGEAPRAVKFAVEGSTMIVTLQPASGVKLQGGKATDIEVAGEDRKFQPGEVKIDGDKLVISSASVPQPVAVRYLWHNAPTACLFNGDGLPVAPFRSDDW